MSGFLEELKRRNIIKFGIAYLATAWLLVQVIDTLVPILALPGSFPKVVVLLVAIGFPIALILAWVYELTPEGVKREDLWEHRGAPDFCNKDDGEWICE